MNSIMPSLNEWFFVHFDDGAINLRVDPPDGAAREEQIKWENIVRVCFKAGAPFESDEIYIFTDGRRESFLIPAEADGGQALWAEILERKLFDAGMADEAATAGNGMFCSRLRTKVLCAAGAAWRYTAPPM